MYNFSNKTAIVRIDYNIPIKDGKILDSFRIDETLSTIKILLDQNCKIILMSHLGSPCGKYDINLSLAPIAQYLEEKLNKKVIFLDNCISEKTEQYIKNAKNGEIILLENLRFHKEEEQNDLGFAKKLRSYADIYINEAFSVSHRNHASIARISEIGKSFPGPLLTNELKNINNYVINPKKPLAAILGGAKISSKLGLIDSLILKVDKIFIAGAMANTFLKAGGGDIGSSFFEEGFIDEANKILKKTIDRNVEILLPVDYVIADNLTSSNSNVARPGDILDKKNIYDIGPKTIELFKNKLNEVSTVLWNGPLGAFEYEPYDQGTIQIAKEIANLTSNKKLISVIGGGDTAFAINKMGINKEFTYVSTGGGAFLAYLENSNLPGLKNLKS